MRMPIVDAHLDLAYNGRRGRDLTLPAAGQASVGEGARSAVPDDTPALTRALDALYRWFVG